MNKDLRSHIELNVSKAKVMQLATSVDDQPWACTVYFVADNQLNLYWLSFPERRHSKELAQNTKAAITMPLKTDVPVIGVSAEGRVAIVEDIDRAKQMIELYVAKYNTGNSFYENLLKGTNKHVMYQFSPQRYVLFDECNFSGELARQELELG